MIIARQPQSLEDFIPHLPQRQLRQIRTQTVGVMQYGLITLAMFSVSAIAGVVAGVVVGVFG
jgi:hypothetical protein